MLNENTSNSPSGIRRRIEAGRNLVAGAIEHGRANLHDVGYQLRLSFIVVVAIPTAISLVFYGLIAAPRYVAQAQFAVWSSSPAKLDPLAMLVQIPTASASLDDQHIVDDYIHSRPMLESVEHRIDLAHIFGSGGDIFSELWPGNSVERRLAFWNRHVVVTIDSSSGISTLEVDAFRPEDALTLANTVLNRAQDMVQNLSDESDRDALRHAKQTFDAATARLSDVRARVTRFRRENHIVDAAHSGQFTSQMVGALEANLAETEAQIQQLQSYLAASDPRIAVLKARAASLRSQIDLQKDGLAETTTAAPANGPDVLPASVLATSEALGTELEIATKSYAAAAASFYEAQANMSRNHRYLEVFVKPALPEEAEKPQRLRMIATVLITSFIAWCLLITVGGAIRDHAGV